VKKLLKNGGLFVLAFTARLREVLLQLHSGANKLSFKSLPVNYTFKNTPLAANFGFKLMLVWEVPPS
jgi:hypothetical protein